MKTTLDRNGIPLRVKLAVILAGILVLVGLTWYMFEHMTFFRQPSGIPERISSRRGHPAQVYTDLDTLVYNHYTIVNSFDAQDTSSGAHSVTIYKSGKLIYQHPEGVEQREFNQFGLVSLLGDSSKQLVIQQYSGGAHCCWTAWVLDLSDSIRFLYQSEDYPEVGYELGISDLDNDGVTELSQAIIAFDYFDRLSHADSPVSVAYFRFSKEKGRYVLANREFSRLILARIAQEEDSVKAAADTLNPAAFGDENGVYLSAVLQVVINYVYAGQRDTGWNFFDKWYSLGDKEDMKKKIQDVLAESKIYQELYRQDNIRN